VRRFFARVDQGWAKGEGVVGAVVLLSMILVAAIQALLRNLTHYQVGWANSALEHFLWADVFLQKGTLFLAFLGASLATRDEKHIAIDVAHRILPEKPKAVLRLVVDLVAAVTCVALAVVFRMSILNNAGDVPVEFSVLGPSGDTAHVCDVTAAAAVEAGSERPGFFCAIRSVLSATGHPVSTPANALELVVPALLLVMSVRFLAKAVGEILDLANPPPPEAKAQEGEASA